MKRNDALISQIREASSGPLLRQGEMEKHRSDLSSDFYAANDDVFQRICIVAALYAACFDYGRDPQGPVPATLSSSMSQLCAEIFGMSLGDDRRSLLFRLLFAQVYQAAWPYFSRSEHPLAVLCVIVQRVGRADARIVVANFVEQYLAEGSLPIWINFGTSKASEDSSDRRQVQHMAAACAVLAIWTDYPDQIILQHEKLQQCATLLLLLAKEKALPPHRTQFLAQEHALLFRDHFSFLYERLTALLQKNAGNIRAEFDRSRDGAQIAAIEKTIAWILSRFSNENDLVEALRGIESDILQDAFLLFHASQIEEFKKGSELVEQDETVPTRCSARDCNAVQHELMATLTMFFPGKQRSLDVRSCKEHWKQIEEQLTSSAYVHALEEKAKEEMGAFLIAPTTIVRYAHPASIPSPKSPEKEPLLLERFRLRQRPLPKSLLVRQIFAEFGMKGLQFLNILHDGYVDLAKKYCLDVPSCAIATYLPQMSLMQAVSSALRDHYLWIEFEEPFETPAGMLAAFSFGVKGEYIFQHALQHSPSSKQMQERLRALLRPQAFDYHIGIDAVDPSGSVFWTFEIAFTRSVQGKIESTYLMPTWVKHCGKLECGNNHPLCPQCLQRCEYYFSLYANCLRLLRGELRETENCPILPEREEKVRRKDPDPRQPHKFQEREISHVIHLVTFNALGRQERRPWNKPQTHRGSWKSQLDPSQIVHWEIDVTFEDGRRLRDRRYRNYIIKRGADPDAPEIQKYGFRIDVRPHKRKQVMSLARLKYHMTKVISVRQQKEQEMLDRVLEDVIGSSSE